MTNDRTQPGSSPVPQEQLTSRFVTSLGRGILVSEFGDGILSNPEALVFDPADLNGRVAFITGASSGLGRATALLFAESGSRVVIAGRDADRANATKEEIESKGGEAFVVIGDMRDPEVAKRTVAEATERFGRIDIGVMDAGIIDDASPLDMTPQQWYNVAHGNGDMTFFPAQAIAQQMITQDKAVAQSLVFISSISMMGNSGQPNYSYAKAGGEAVAKAFARSKDLKDVSVGILRPGLIDTEMIHRMGEPEQRAMNTMARAMMPLKRMLTPDEGARGVAFLATRKESGHILTLT